MRVAVLVQQFYPRVGGAERQLLQVIPRLRCQGIDVHVLTRRYQGLPRFEEVRGIPVHRLPVPGGRATASLAFTAAAQPLMVQLRPDILHPHELLSPTTTALVARALLRRPVFAKVLSGGELDWLSSQRGGHRRLQMLVRRIDGFHVVSREIDEALDRLGVGLSRRWSIPNGVDAEHFRPLSRSERQVLRDRLQLPATAPIVVYTGRLSAEKGIRQLLAGWRRLHPSYPTAQLLVVGEGALADEVRGAVGDNVRLVGTVTDVAPYLQAADVFVLPSLTEGMSNSLLEAMATGVDIVATAVGGTMELTQDGNLARLVPADNVERLASALTAAFAERQMPSSMATLRRRQVVTRFALDASAQRLRAAYEALHHRHRMDRSCESW